MKYYTPSQAFPYNEVGLNNIIPYSIFLAGTIDDGNSKDWQNQVYEDLKDKPGAHFISLLNPRCYDYDVTKQTLTNKKFKNQVNWEQDGLKFASLIFMYIIGGSRSIISMSELGQYANTGKLVVVAEKDYFKRGNIEVLSEREEFPLFDNFEEGYNYATAIILGKYLGDTSLIEAKLKKSKEEIEEMPLVQIDFFAKNIRQSLMNSSLKDVNF